MTDSTTDHYTAAVATLADVTEDGLCDVAVIQDETFYELDDETGEEKPTYRMTDRLAMEPTKTDVRVDDPDKLEKAKAAAEKILADNGWTIAGSWNVADNAMYATVEDAS